MNVLTSRPARVALVVVLQLGIVGAAVSAQLSARLTGEEYLLRVGPVDPIDPFRGAYVQLSYPDLLFADDPWDGELSEGDESDDVFVPLKAEGDLLVASGPPSLDRPDDGLYIRCTDADWQLRCGIESLFLPQDEAARVQKDINQSGLWGEEFDEEGMPVERDEESGYAARVKIDSRGNAAVLELVKR